MSSQPEHDASALVESVVDKYADELIDLRRDLHAHPELSWHERRTTDVVADRLGGLGLEVTRLPASSAQGTRSGTGLVAEVGTEPSGAHLYGTTASFLERMGFTSLDQLPPLAPYLPDIDGLDDLGPQARVTSVPGGPSSPTSMKEQQ